MFCAQLKQLSFFYQLRIGIILSQHEGLLNDVLNLFFHQVNRVRVSNWFAFTSNSVVPPVNEDLLALRIRPAALNKRSEATLEAGTW
jgi:hypothetical protein